MDGMERKREWQAGQPRYNRRGRLKGPKTILMISLRVARTARVKEKGVGGNVRAVLEVIEVDFQRIQWSWA